MLIYVNIYVLHYAGWSVTDDTEQNVFIWRFISKKIDHDNLTRSN